MADSSPKSRRGAPRGRRARRDPWPRSSVRRAWFRDHCRVAGQSLRHVSHRFGTTLLAWLLVGIALAFPAALFLVQSGLSNLTDRWDDRPGLSVYFEPGTSPAPLATKLRGQPGVQEVGVITQDEALAEFLAQTRLGDALETLDTNPLPASLRVVPAAGTGAAHLERLAALARQSPGATEVVVERIWLERVAAAASAARRMGAILAALFAIGAVLVTATSVRLAIEGRLRELRVMKLVGANDAQVRRPFLYLGMFYGLGGGLVAAMLLSVAIGIVEGPFTRLLGSFDVEFEAAAFDAGFVGILLGTGGLLGIAGAVIGVRQRQASLDQI